MRSLCILIVLIEASSLAVGHPVAIDNTGISEADSVLVDMFNPLQLVEHAAAPITNTLRVPVVPKATYKKNPEALKAVFDLMDRAHAGVLAQNDAAHLARYRNENAELAKKFEMTNVEDLRQLHDNLDVGHKEIFNKLPHWVEEIRKDPNLRPGEYLDHTYLKEHLDDVLRKTAK